MIVGVGVGVFVGVFVGAPGTVVAGMIIISGDTGTVFVIAAGGFVYHFMLGPISVQATYYDTKALGKSKFGFVVHAGFLLRNKRWDD